MTLTELRYVVALADHDHFGRAAEACHVSQPTLSAQLKKLEGELGVRLFERTNRRVAPTVLGEQVIAQARRVLEEAARIPELAGRHREPLSGPLRLGVIPTLGPYLLPALVAPLHAAYPRLDLVLREDLTANLVTRLRDHGLDVVLAALPVPGAGPETGPGAGAGPGVGGGLVCEALFDEPFWAILPPGHVLAAKSEIGEADLARYRLLLLDEGHCFRDQALAVCGRTPAQIGNGAGGGADAQAGNRVGGDDFRAASLETVRGMVGAGLGVSLLPALALRPGSPGDLAVALRPFRAPVPRRRIGLVWRRGYPRAAALKELADFIRAHLPGGVEAVARPAAA